MTSKRNADVTASPIQDSDLVRKATWGLIHGIAAQRTFAEMLIHAGGMDESDAPSLEEVAHMVAGMAERLDLHLDFVKSFVFDQVGGVKA
jgi:hypothetical protein